jgi:hypothetical protein
VAVVIWTGGFIVRGWMQMTSLGLMAGMNYLQFAFLAAILALLADPLTLRWLAVFFFIYYTAFFLRHGPRLSARDPNLTLFVPFFDVVRVQEVTFWITLQLVELIPLVIVFVWPDPRVVAWCCVVMTFLGYQIILAFVYSDIFTKNPE